MSFFKRKDNYSIPPVEDTARNELFKSSRGTSNSNSPQPSYRPSSSNTYVASRDEKLYQDDFDRKNRDPAPQSDAYAYRDKYSRNNPVGDVYSRGGAKLEDDRNELFAGYNPQNAGSGRFFDGPQLREPGPGEENEEDVEGIKQQTRFVKQESVNSTRNALRLAREAEETARNTLGRLGDQSERLANTERHLDISKTHTQKANDRTGEIKQLNRSIFRPVIVFNKDSKRRAKEQEIQERYDEEKAERERGMVDVRETQNRLGRAAGYGRDGEGSGRFKSAEQRKEQRKRYQFEADEEDDRLEDEIDDNLDEISDMTKRLKALGTAMGQELDSQNTRIDRIDQKASSLDNRLFSTTQRLNRIK